MKTYLFLIYLSLPFLGFGQLKGEFSAGNGIVTETIKFKKDKTFDFELSGSAGILCFGTGTYTLQDSNLTLHFINPYDSIQPIIKIDAQPTNSDSISIQYKMKEQTKKEDDYILGAVLEVLNENNLEENIALELIKSTDLEGIGVLKLPVSDTITPFRIYALGCMNVDFEIVLNQNYDVYSECIIEYRYIDTGIKFEYIIREKKRKQLLMSSNKNMDGFLEYTKKRSLVGRIFNQIRFYFKRKIAVKRKNNLS